MVLPLLNYLFLLENDYKLFLNTALFVNAVISFFFLFFYRIIVKQTFERYVNISKSSGRIKALISGFDANAIAVANALRCENPQRFKLLGFIDQLNRNESKKNSGSVNYRYEASHSVDYEVNRSKGTDHCRKNFE